MQFIVSKDFEQDGGALQILDEIVRNLRLDLKTRMNSEETNRKVGHKQIDRDETTIPHSSCGWVQSKTLFLPENDREKKASTKVAQGRITK